MERVNHVHVIKIGSCGLICYVYGMIERKVPDRECLKLGIAGLDTVFLLLIELAQAYGHLAASGARSCNDNKRTRGDHIIISSESLIGIYQGHVIGITFNYIVYIGHDTQAFETLTESIGT